VEGLCLRRPLLGLIFLSPSPRPVGPFRLVSNWPTFSPRCAFSLAMLDTNVPSLPVCYPFRLRTGYFCIETQGFPIDCLPFLSSRCCCFELHSYRIVNTFLSLDQKDLTPFNDFERLPLSSAYKFLSWLHMSDLSAPLCLIFHAKWAPSAERRIFSVLR